MKSSLANRTILEELQKTYNGPRNLDHEFYI